MKKYSLYITLSSFAAFFAILAACGSGEIVDLSEGSTEFNDILGPDGSLSNLTGQGAFIAGCDPANEYELCKQLYSSVSKTEPSSSSDAPYIPGEHSSSSEGPVNPGESSSSTGEIINPGVSSSDGGGTPPSSSSSTPPPPPSSSATCTENCATVPSFTCAVNPNNPISGDDATFNVNIVGSSEGCNSRVYAEYSVTNNFGNHVRWAQANIPQGVPVTIAGTIPANVNGDPSFTWKTSGSIEDIKSDVTCGTGASANTKTEPCNLTVRAAPAPTPSGTFTFTTFDYSSASSFYFYNGTNVTAANTNFTPTSITVTNNADAKCELPPTVELSGCGAPGAVQQTGTANCTITANVVATCRGSKVVLRTASATVVPDPTVTGTCTWDTKNNTFGGGVSAKILTAPTIGGQAGRTCEGPYFTVDRVKKETVAAGLKVDTWTSDPQTMTNIAITATCAGKTLNLITCPNITVKDPAATCEYVPASMCNGIAIGQVITAAQNVSSGTAGSKCFYATSVTDMRGADFTINGTASAGCNNAGEWGLTSCNTVLNAIDKVDGGYYIYAGGWINNLITANTHNGLHANCK